LASRVEQISSGLSTSMKTMRGSASTHNVPMTNDGLKDQVVETSE